MSDAAPALLLVGPTGSGKSPLGDLLEREGLDGRACHHLDFGALLRAAADGRVEVPRAHRRVILDVLETGRLLEDDEWPVAVALIDGFLETAPGRLVILNGLPRDLGQAGRVAALLRVEAVVHLEATPEVLLARIRRNTGGDRGERRDDEPERIRSRIQRFETRTRPLLQYYASRGVPVLGLPIDVGTTAADCRARLACRYDPRT